MSARDQMILWAQADLHIADIRLGRLEPGERFSYRAPAGLFLISAFGEARIEAGSLRHSSLAAPVVHVGKGSELRVDASPQGYEYFLFLYKAVLPTVLPTELDDPEQAVRDFHSCYLVPAGVESAWRNTAGQIHQLWQEKHPLSRLDAKQQFYSFVSLLLKELEQREGNAEQAKQAEANLVDTAVRYMEAHYSELWTLASLAERLGTSPRQLQRGFKTRFGHSPMEHFIGIRLEQAKLLLIKNQLPISRIAEEVGYPDSYYFSRLFKKYTGLSPRSYRQLWLQEHNPSNAACRISPTFPSQSVIVPFGENRYHQKGSALQAFQALLSLTLACTSGIARMDPDGKLLVPHVRGRLELERQPQRIAVLDYQYADQLLALGIVPVGSAMCTIETGGLPADLRKSLRRIADLGKKEQPDLRVLAALEPDLIVCTSFQEEHYADISAIAPAIMLDRNEDWRLSLLRFGELVGRTWQALEQIDAYNAKVERLRRRIGNGRIGGDGGSETVALIRPRDGGIRVHSERHRTARLLYDDLGLALPSFASHQEGTSSLIPLQELSQLSADRLFVLTDNTNREQLRQYQQSLVWRQMSAVRAGQVRHFHTALWTGYYGPLAMSRVVDEIAETLLSSR
ncbi:AraC family transcriptional regulator [Paenibacillus sanguinis]|uniref:AraC family transcriptional regulator n=1 Tax=Paenibacillus sanguinis TaxID=225906 RepID=UPI00036F5ECF|nr:AraC family transcriptional regulator [Paenibacillus sanguinis]